MMHIRIEPVSDKKGLKKFIHFPFTLYRDNRFWVPPILKNEWDTFLPDRNPAFEVCDARCWLAFNGSRVVGRIAGIINRLYIGKWGKKHARFGWIDFVDDSRVSAALLGTVEDWASSQGMEAVHGPLGFTNMDHAGMLVEGFDELATQATIYNHAYYPGHLEAAGYRKDRDWVEYEMPMVDAIDDKFFRLADKVRSRYGLHLLKVSKKKDLLPYARRLFELMEAEYARLYASVPLTEAQVENYIQQYFALISPEFVPIVLDEIGEMVAFGVALPSLSRALQKSRGRLFPFGFLHIMRALRKNDRADLYLVAVRGDYQGRGVNAILITEMFRVFRDFGIRVIESNPELEDNIAVQAQWRHFGRRQHKHRRAYIKYL